MGCCSDGPPGLISTFCPCWHSELQARVIPGGGRVLADKRGRMDFFKVNCCSPVRGVSQCCNGLHTLCIAAQLFISLPDLSLACLANQPSFFFFFTSFFCIKKLELKPKSPNLCFNSCCPYLSLLWKPISDDLPQTPRRVLWMFTGPSLPEEVTYLCLDRVCH